MSKLNFPVMLGLAFLVVLILALLMFAQDREDSGLESDNKILTIGVFPKGIQGPLYELEKAKRFLESEGIEPHFVEYGMLPLMTQAFSANKIDIAWSGISQAAYIYNAEVPVKIVWAHANAVEQLVVRADSAISTTKDLEGKTIGTPGETTTAHTLFRLVGASQNFPLDNVRYFQASQDNLVKLLGTGKIDAAILKLESIEALRGDSYRVLSNLSSEWQGMSQENSPFVLVVSLANPEFAMRNPNMLSAYARAMRKLQDFAISNPEEVSSILQPLLNTSSSNFYAERWNEIYLNEWGSSTRAAIRSQWAAMRDLDLLDSIPNEEIFLEIE